MSSPRPLSYLALQAMIERNDTVRGFIRQLKLGAFAWPGGYPVALALADGENLCYSCAHENRAAIIEETREPAFRQGWAAAPVPCPWEINFEDPELYCCHCNGRIESAYAEPEEKEGEGK